MNPGINKDLTWYVVRTNIKCERKAAHSLRRAGIDCYLPTMREERKNKRTHTYRTSEKALMPRYLFAGTTLDPYFIRLCEGVEGVLGTFGHRGAPISVSPEAVEQILIAEIDLQFDETRAARIHRQEEAKTKKATTELRFFPGAEIEITDGVWKGFSGLVEQVTTRGNVQALVDVFGRLTPVEVPVDQIATAA